MSQAPESSQPPRPLKRRHTESTPATPGDKLRRNPRFWFSDGNIVLTDGKSAFRVYRGVLASQSSVFADMLDFPQPTESTPQMDGCPIVELSDSGIDLTAFLGVIFPLPSVGVVWTQSTIHFASLSAIVRLAHKYQCHDILRQALKVLTSYYTRDHDKWKARANHPLIATPEDAIDAVLLARLTDTPAVLATALFQCTHLGPGIMDGVMRLDKSHVMLSNADIALCLRARESIAALDLLGLQHLVQIVSSNRSCYLPKECRNAAFAFGKAAALGFDGYDRASLPPWVNVIVEFMNRRVDNLVVSFCHSCAQCINASTVLTSSRSGTWQRLPGIFGVTKD